jgi:hypothetical protein
MVDFIFWPVSVGIWSFFATESQGAQSAKGHARQPAQPAFHKNKESIFFLITA